MVGNIAGSLIAFLAFVAFINGVLSWFGGLVGAPFLTLEYLLGWIFYPLSWIMGVNCSPHCPVMASTGLPVDTCCPEDVQDDCRNVAVLVGLKSIVNEFAAYDRLGGFTV